MFQTIDGRNVFVVELAQLPDLPITDGGIPHLKPYAEALELAILSGIVKAPGKFGIEITDLGTNYNIYEVKE
jgi:hypothetical protein